MDRRETGERGERIAARHLRWKGFRILERGWRCPIGELDLVAREGPVLVFVEVKTRHAAPGENAPPFGAPEEAVTAAKRRKLAALARWYLKRVRPEPPCRFDVVAVVFPAPRPGLLGRLFPPRPRIHHIRGAFSL